MHLYSADSLLHRDFIMLIDVIDYLFFMGVESESLATSNDGSWSHLVNSCQLRYIYECESANGHSNE